MKFLYSFFVLLFLAPLSLAQSFTDVSASHKNYDAIESLKTYGIVKGYEDGSFKPESTINRAESLKIILLGSGIQANTSESNGGFSDVDVDAWFTPYVVKAKNLGIVKGNPDGTFLPNKNVNLAEALKMTLLTNAVTVSQKTLTANVYADVAPSDWFAPYFAYAQENHLLDTKSYNKVAPGHSLTRAELAEIMFRLRSVLEQKGQESLSLASYYSDTLDGNSTASGEKYDKTKFTAAHKELPFGTRVEVTNTLNSKSVIVKINDRGPFVEGRVIDLSKAAFEAISSLSAGVIPVSLRVLSETGEDFQSSLLTAVSDCVVPKITEDDFLAEDFFTNAEENIAITLYQKLRTKYQEHEVLDISGKVTDQSIKEVTAFLKDSEGGQKVFRAEVKSGDFLLQFDVGDAGEKQLLLVSGTGGKNYVAPLVVSAVTCEKELSNPEILEKASNEQFYIENNNVILRWNSGESDLSRVFIKQADSEEVRYFSGGKQGWKLTLADFENFSQGDFYLRVDLAMTEDQLLRNAKNQTEKSKDSVFTRGTTWKEGDLQHFIATQHNFSKINTDFIQVQELSDTYGFGGEISFKVRTKAPTRPNIEIIKPSGNVEVMAADTDAEITENTNGVERISANQQFNFIYVPTEHGTHIIEINHESGVASLNVPVYEKGKIPLIPDFVDLQESQTSIVAITDEMLKSADTELLNYINRDRLVASKERLELNHSLGLLAQSRADDMAKNNYLSHWNAEGQSANDLRVALGIKNSVGENLAKEQSVLHAHEGLMRSAAHRRNLLDDHWTQLGVGVAKSSDGGVIVVEIFSSDEVQLSDVPVLREEMLETMNSKRESLLVPSAALTAVAQLWSDKMALESFADEQDLNALSAEIEKAGITSSVSVFIIGNTSWQAILENQSACSYSTSEEQLACEGFYSATKWKRLGVGVTQDNDGVFMVTLLFADE